MREIKFRGLSKCQTFWRYGYYTKDSYGKNFIESIDSKQVLGGRVHGYSVGQFTGLKDKNGTEIYEGDIIQVNGETKKHYDDLFEPPETVEFELLAEVTYNESFAFFELSTIEADLNMKHWGFYGEGTENHLEVVGNIHENPELLETKVNA